MEIDHTNIFYFRKICAIGGTEQFLYEIAKKLYMYDITVFYDDADEFQLNRLRKLVRCKKRIQGEIVRCKRAFFNFNLDMIKDVEADEYYFVSHANYEELGYTPPIKHPKLTNYIGVSQFATDKLDKYAEMIGSKIKTQRCYNPLTLEPTNKVIHLVSACRLDDKVKGGERTLKLIEALDRYCKKNNRNYIWTIFTNQPYNIEIKSLNVVIMKPRVDVRPYIADADYVLQLSNDMETYCYTINEALGYGVPIITTPLSILKELPITDNEHLVLEYDCSNANEIAKQIFEKKVNPFKYNPPPDNWEDLIIKEKSRYEEEKRMKYLIEATEKYVETNTYDAQRSEEESKKKGEKVIYFPQKGEQWEVDFDRKEILCEKGFAIVVKEIDEPKEKIIENAIVNTDTIENATKTRKTKKASK